MKSIISIICITALIAYALYLGFDGLLLAGGVAVIGGLGGYAVKRVAPSNKQKKPD